MSSSPGRSASAIQSNIRYRQIIMLGSAVNEKAKHTDVTSSKKKRE